MKSDSSSEIKSFLDTTEALGCEMHEVLELENRYRVKFPSDYIEFLVYAGRGAESLWRGSDYRIDRLPLMQEAAAELLSDVGLALPEGAFVFFMHQGYQFFFIADVGVFFFLEGNRSFEKRCNSFTEFFNSTKDIL